MSTRNLAGTLDEYLRLTPASRALYERAASRLPGGVASSVRFFPPYPLFMSRAAGARIYDADGREYIDYCLAFGALVAGHGHRHVMDAIRRELDRAGTVIFGAPTELEYRFAERLASVIPSAEMVRFTNSGTEATMHALRIARGATGRSNILKFEGHYHGAHDAVLLNLDAPLPKTPDSDGIPGAVFDATIIVPFGDLAAVKRALEGTRSVAALIVEPIARGAIAPDPLFLQGIRELTARHGVVLIFDEVVTWPRVSLGGAQALYGVTPDITALGKAIGGGLPMGAVVGRRDLLSLTAPRPSRAGSHQRPGTDSGEPHVFHGGTYNATPVALAAGMAVLELLEEPRTFDMWMSKANGMREALRQLFVRRGVEGQVIGTGSMLDFYFTSATIRSSRDIWSSDLETRRAVDYRLLTDGIYNSPLHRFHLSLAHSDADIERTIEAIDRALSAADQEPKAR